MSSKKSSKETQEDLDSNKLKSVLSTKSKKKLKAILAQYEKDKRDEEVLKE